jgi:hypothetical protein
MVGDRKEKSLMNRRHAFALALVAVLMTAAGAYADTSRDDTQAPRGLDAHRLGVSDQQPGTEIQAP